MSIDNLFVFPIGICRLYRGGDIHDIFEYFQRKLGILTSRVKITSIASQLLTMESATCLSIPPLSQSRNHEDLHFTQPRSRFLVVSENEILHAAGNTLRLSPLPNIGNHAATDSNASSANYSMCGGIDDIDELERTSIFAEAERGRGFSCIAYDSYRRRVAYSPRKPRPSIYIKTTTGRHVLCEIQGGVTIEYQDVCFNRNGSRLAAIGRGTLDSKLFVWDLTTNKGNENGDQCKMVPLLIASHSFQCSVSKCLFDPSNENVISILASDHKTIIKSQLSKFVGKHKVTESLYDIPSGLKNIDVHISTVSWESNSRLLIGLEDGSILIVQDSVALPETYQVKTEGIGRGAVRTITISSMYILVGFQNGKLLWFRRLESLKVSLSNHEFEADLGSDIMQVANTPDFETVVAYTAKGELCTYWVDADKNKKSNDAMNKEMSRGCSRYSEGVVTGVACIVLVGKAGVSVFVTGNSNGSIKVWRDKENVNMAYDMLGCVETGTPITAIEPLKGYPVFAVGFADSSVKFFHVGKRKSGSHVMNGAVEVDLTMIKSEVLDLSPVTHLAFNEKTKKLAAGCYESGQVFVLCTEPSNLHVIGVLENKANLASMSWSESQPSHIFVGTSTSSLSCFDTLPLCFTPEPLKPLWTCNLSSVVRGLVTTSTLQNEASTLCICNRSKGIDFYDVCLSQQGCEVKHKYHDVDFANEVTCLLIDGSRIFAGTKTGELAIFEPTERDDFDVQLTSRLHCSPVVAICISSDGSRLYSSALDGSVFVQTASKSRGVVHSSYDYDYLVS